VSLTARIAAAAAAVLMAGAVLVAAAASAVTAAATSPLTAVWRAVVGNPAKTQARFVADDYVRIIAVAESEAASSQAARAIAFAAAQIGLPYVWGGTGPTGGSVGYDCSGLMEIAYRTAGVDIPRVATDQYRKGVKVELQSLRPGDLVYYGGPAFAHHVAMYLGTSRGVEVVLDAPHTGAVVRLDPLAARDLFGATRPASASDRPSGPRAAGLPGAYPSATPAAHSSARPATPGR
jgi:cell wall-associated NlpC family hydrolase